jgi:hypothetical protein
MNSAMPDMGNWRVGMFHHVVDGFHREFISFTKENGKVAQLTNEIASPAIGEGIAFCRRTGLVRIAVAC